MTLYLALLRGINVSGRNRVSMKELSEAMTAAGFRRVSSYLQTGNVLFDSDEGDTDQLAARLRDLIDGEFGNITPVVIRTTQELYEGTSEHPFLADEDDYKRLHVMFLDRVPAADDVEALDPERSPGDRFLVEGRHIFLHLPNGAGRSKLTVDYFERHLGVTATARNWNTVLKLQSMMADRTSR